MAKEVPPHARKKRVRRGSRAKGVAYEQKAQEHLREVYGWAYLPSPWIRFKLRSGSLKWCQPDGLHFDVREGRLTIVEIKHSHTSDAYRQLWEQYWPVLQHIFPRELWDYRFLEVVRWYDPMLYFPGQHRLRKTIQEVRPNETGVYIWNPSR